MSLRSLFVLLLASTIFITEVDGAAHSTVQVLNSENFDNALADPANGLWLLKFYAPWYVCRIFRSYRMSLSMIKANNSVPYILIILFPSSVSFLVFTNRCGHCKTLSPVLDKVAPHLAGKMAIGKVRNYLLKSK